MADDTARMKAKPPADPARALVLDHRTGVVSSNPLPREIFVFGSNTAGRHGKGAALFAFQYRGAVYGQGEGLQGDSYAIPTKKAGRRGPMAVMALDDIARAVDRFLDIARANPDLTFKLTKIGCGLAGFAPDKVAPLFIGAPRNVVFPFDFVQALEREAEKARRVPAVARMKSIRDTLRDRHWHRDEG